MPAPIDAVLLVSFGGPEQPHDVVPFLENVTRGRGIPPERLVEVGQHYFEFGGKSPINDQNRALMAAMREDFDAHGIDLPIYWGNRNWDPYLREATEQMAADGVRRAACFITSAYSSYSSCRQYREDLFAAGDDLPVELLRIGRYALEDGFVTPFVEGTREALAEAPSGTRVVFVTHSIPDQMNDASGGPGVGAYRLQHLEVAEKVMAQLDPSLGHAAEWDLVYCSRSGSPHVPWLEPDVNDHLEALAADGVTSVVLVPIGFISDHMEVIYDLDTEAKATAEGVGLWFRRVPTPGTHPAFVELIREKVVASQFILCGMDCCVNPRSDRPVRADR